MSKIEYQLQSAWRMDLCTIQFLADVGVPYMDQKLYESSFTRSWNHLNWFIEERDMHVGVTKGHSAREEHFCSITKSELEFIISMARTHQNS